jgi:DNA mismatch repair protein MutS2
MIYPRNFEEKVGFDRIREMLLELCQSPMGQFYVEKIRFTSNQELISRLLNQTEEFRQLLLKEGNFPSGDYFDLSPELKRIAIVGTYIEQDKLFNLKSSLETIIDCIAFITKQDHSKFPELITLVAPVSIEPDLTRQIDRIIDNSGEIKNSASSQLGEIRRKLISKRSSIDKKINYSFQQAKKSGWVNSDSEITIRNGRLVIPVPAAYKRQMRGFIHDQSATGQTIYIEPEEVFETNNEIREIEGEERREVIRILKDFSEFVRPQIPSLLEAYRFLGMIDFIRAKAKFALRINAVKPQLLTEPQLFWNQSVHPLLYLSHIKQKKTIVPLDITLNQEQRILVISGPNAGGKSVCLKTIGLLQYMLQCGLLIPVKDDSKAGVFASLFIDIGDEQSLENDLSTYSSHLTNMKHFVLNANSSSLFLIDEFGTGTEPQLGGAIAQAVLEKLNENKAFGVVTTHYSNLKLIAGKGNGIINGAMLFDTKAMQPLYQLSIGKPGSSFAFEIARKIGFPKQILKEAEHYIGKKQLDFDEQLQQLEIEKRTLEKEQQKVSAADGRLQVLIDKYQGLLQNLDAKKSEIILKAKMEAESLIDSSNKLIENTIREIREVQADKEKTKLLRANLKDKEKKIKEIKTETTKPNDDKSAKKAVTKAEVEKNKELLVQSDKLLVGDYVKIIEQDVNGEVLEIIDDEVVVGFNSIRFKTQLNKIEKLGIEPPKSSVQRSSKKSSVVNDLNDKLANFKHQLDVRGKRGEEAIELVRQFIDDAILLNVREVRILHGKGFGILRTMIHEFLRTVSEIQQFHDEHIERGGHGITIVILK